MQQDDRHGRDAVFPQGRQHLRQGGDIDRLENLAAGRNPLVNLETQIARDERLREFQLKIIDVVSDLVPHLQYIAEPCGRDQRRRTALALDQRVDHQCRSVNENIQIARKAGACFPIDVDPVQHALFRCRRCRRHLLQFYLASAVVNPHEVRERSADVATKSHTASLAFTHSRQPRTPRGDNF